MSNYYSTIDKPSMAEFKDRGSRFLAYAFPIEGADDFKKRLKSLKDEHAKAAHHCFAYRIGTDGNTFRSSDDGEPSGSGRKTNTGAA
jgi:putative IMPACT (imprinted ancient) family translation regulator